MATELDSIVELHPELHHYTTFDGLEGIFKTKTLWATAYRKLNDSSELKILPSHLEKALAERIYLLAIRARLSLLDDRARRFLEYCKDPSEFAYVHAGAIVDALNDVVVGSKAAYVTSFCSHRFDNHFERTHGLLSQWRGYSHDGGYAIVFDTKSLADCLRREANANYWTFLTFEPVVYAEDHVAIAKRFENLIGEMESTIASALTDGQLKGYVTVEQMGQFVRGHAV